MAAAASTAITIMARRLTPAVAVAGWFKLVPLMVGTGCSALRPGYPLGSSDWW